MGHFAKVKDNIVVNVIVAEPEQMANRVDTEAGEWVQTSYNTSGGVHYDPETGQPSADQSKALRKNYAGIGHIYDFKRDAFYAPQPYPSWTLNEETCWWEPPVPFPTTDGAWQWNETTQSWDEVTA